VTYRGSCPGEWVMRAVSGPTFDLATFMPASSEDQGVALQRSASGQRGRHKIILASYLISAPVATIASVRPVLGEIIKPFRCCQRQAQNCQPQGNADLPDLSHACPSSRSS
jgi:hypothetical protein